MRTIAAILDEFSGFPFIDIANLLNGRRALILAPHPDDESIGCGGLIAAACDAGLAPVVVILTDGAASHPGSTRYPPRRLCAIREQEAREATRWLGLPPQNLYFLGASDSMLPSAGTGFDRSVGRLHEIGRAHGCEMVFSTWLGDPHCDHQAAAVIAAKLCTHTGWAPFSYPVWGWLRENNEVFDEQRRHGWRLNISSTLKRKRKAIAAHQTQRGAFIEDSPMGFSLPEALLRIFDQNFEVYIND